VWYFVVHGCHEILFVANLLFNCFPNKLRAQFAGFLYFVLTVLFYISKFKSFFTSQSARDQRPEIQEKLLIVR